MSEQITFATSDFASKPGTTLPLHFAAGCFWLDERQTY